ncbi:MAG: ribosome small subunit-dependent GTPase A [Spirosomataceae bacterium]
MTPTQQKGLVIRSTGSWYDVRQEDGSLISCRLRGKFKIQGLKVTNPIAVGDSVFYHLEDEAENRGMITEIVPRTNYILRKSVHKTAHGHILAANLDQAILLVTLTFPRTSLGFIDRFLVSAESFRIPTRIVFNKIDLMPEEALEYQQELAELYEPLGYPCHFISALTGAGVEELQKQLENKISLIAGHSGVGKSTFINAIAPGFNLRTSEVSTFANKGVHTTTFAEMFELPKNTFLIDSPGIKELGIMDIETGELNHYFPEFAELLNTCKYHNCRHINEPQCKVKEGIENGTIAESRYLSYLSILEDQDNRR